MAVVVVAGVAAVVVTAQVVVAVVTAQVFYMILHRLYDSRLRGVTPRGRVMSIGKLAKLALC